MAARSTEERIALIDAKISKKQEEIKTLEAQKQKLLRLTLIANAKSF